MDDSASEGSHEDGVAALYEVGKRHEAAKDFAAAAEAYGKAAATGGGKLRLRVNNKRLKETCVLPAVRGDLNAQVALAALHYCGRRDGDDAGGFVRSQKTCVKWLEVAAARGSTDAMDALGYCYFEGHGVPEDAPRAEALWAESLEKQRAAKVEAAEKARAEAEAAEARAREADAEAGAKDDEAEGAKDEEDDAGAKEEEAGDEEAAKGEEAANDDEAEDEAEVEEADAENEEAADEPEEDEENDDPAPPPPEESDDPAPPPPKRKRGRPPKVRAPEPAPDAPPAKRKRGRPPKAR